MGDDLRVEPGQSPGGAVARELLGEIQHRLGFVPPFFEAAANHPKVLQELWRQTLAAYLENPLPELFKEKVAAALGRHCSVPYCLMCHSCALRPLGLAGDGIVRLLRGALPGDEEVRAALALATPESLSGDPLTAGSPVDDAVIVLACAIYAAGHLAEASRQAIRRLLGNERYDHLILFIAYNRMCHDWVAAHPEISFELDRRYSDNFPALADEAPELVALLGIDPGSHDRSRRGAAESVSAARAIEVERLEELAERRLREVIGSLKARLDAAQGSAFQERQLREELEQTARFAQEVLAIIGHDLRNPVAVIGLCASRILQLHPDDEPLARVIHRIHASADRANRLLGDLLDYSQARIGGGIPIVRHPTDMAHLIRRVVEDVEITVPTRPVDVDISVSGEAFWDGDRVMQTLANLMGNAVTHGADGSSIAVRAWAVGQSVSISICNANRDGAIPSELVPHLFEPFRRGGVGTTARNKSVGLGLYIVKQIIDGHGGTIHVDSLRDRTTVTVTLPRA
jgi:sigma-B regulation protein RsbU (phosphoserine phosphatase)